MINDSAKKPVYSGIYAWKSDGEPFVGTTGLFYQPSAAPVPPKRMDAPLAVADINENDTLEIIGVSVDTCLNSSGGHCMDPWINGHVFIINHSGSCITDWEYADPDHFIRVTNTNLGGPQSLPAPSVADINGDGHFEVVIAGFEYIYAWDRNGVALEHFPIFVPGLDPQNNTPLLADIDGDNKTDILMASHSENERYNGIFAYSSSGQPLVGFPLHIGRVFATPTIDDIDNDGKSELVASAGPNVYAWDLEGRADRILWGKTRLNTANNAVYDNPCGITAAGQTLTDDANWTVDRSIGGPVTIPNGVTLTIRARVRFSTGGQIVVEPGGRLFIDHGTLTSACETPWNGIKVIGNRDLPQSPTSNQGFVNIFNHSVIENASPAIQSEYGGIIMATDAEFRNNRRSVILASYPGFKNTSALTRCRFVFDDTTRLDGNEFFVGAQLVNPVTIAGCTFENTIPWSDIAAGHRGTGILLSNAALSVTRALASEQGPDPEWVTNTFRGLYYGAYTMGSLNGYPSTIFYSNFEDNVRGLYQSGYNGIGYTAVGLNSFRVLRPDVYPEVQGYGMYLNSCSGYTVEENEFYSEGATPAGTGLIINESGPGDNQIYNNSFANLDQGAKPQGQNRLGSTHGLCFKCNDFSGNHNDIMILSENPNAQNQGIALSQGSTINAAKNTFSQGNDAFYDLYNPFTEIQYYSDNMPVGAPVYPEPVYGVKRNPIETNYNKSEDCPSHFGHPKTEELKEEMADSRFESDSIAQSLNLLVDGGSTEALAGEVNQSTPSQALDTRDQLLDASPWLSDSVMKAAVVKEEVLTNAMIRDVLIENPQSAKSTELMSLIDQRFNPMPDSMTAEIMAGLEVLGPKEIKEIARLERNQNYAEKFISLIRAYSEDSTCVDPTDSLKDVLHWDRNLGSYYDLVSLYFRSGQYDLGFQTLDSIPVLFDLSQSETAWHAEFEQLFSIMHQADTSQSSLESLDSLQFQSLAGIALTDPRIPGIHARDLLIGEEMLDYNEPILEPVCLKSSGKWTASDASLTAQHDYWFRLWPNPAKGHFTVEYSSLHGSGNSLNASLEISDIYGKRVVTYTMNRSYSQIVIPTARFSAGNYILRMYVAGSLKQSAKVTIIQ